MNNALKAASAIAAQRLASVSDFRAKKGGKMVRFKPDELRKAQAEAWDKAMEAAIEAAPQMTGNCSNDSDLGWDEGIARYVSAIRAFVNPYRSKTDD